VDVLGLMMSEFFDYLEGLARQIESGALGASSLRSTFSRDWGGERVSLYIPKGKTEANRRIAELVQAGVNERTARRKVRGK